MVSGLLLVAAFPALSAKGVKNETIEASAMGTGTQMGQVISISIEIYDYSTPEDKQVLVQAFSKGQNQGLVNALTKMHAVGHISITGTLGYDLAYIGDDTNAYWPQNPIRHQPSTDIRRSLDRLSVNSLQSHWRRVRCERHEQEQEHGRIVSGVPTCSRQGWPASNPTQSKCLETGRCARLERHGRRQLKRSQPGSAPNSGLESPPFFRRVDRVLTKRNSKLERGVA